MQFSSQYINKNFPVELGSRVNQPNEYRMTALHYAASSGSPESVLALIGDPIINVNARNYLGWTPLHCAVI